MPANNFGNNAGDGYNAHPYIYNPKWIKDVDYNPDHRPAESPKLYIDENDNEKRWVMQVKGEGVLVFHATRSNNELTLAIFSKDEIGPCPKF